MMQFAPGNKLGPYEIQSPLGAGGMGEVYRARDTRLERTVAIKILPSHLSSDPVRKQRFEREAKTISSLNHPHICVLYDVGDQDGIDYLVMECVEGETLAKRLEKGPLPLEQVLKYGAQIADALDIAHRSGVVHRDMKPGNIILTPMGTKLLDFGLAKPTAQLVSGATLTTAVTQDSPVTEQGMIVGTFQYMSPEQVEGKEVDGRSDIFSLGAVLYEMVTGKKAFEGTSRLSVASAILEKEPQPIAAVKPTTLPALAHTIGKCLAKAPDERWQSAADIKHEIDWISQSLAEALAGLGVPPKKARIRMASFVLGAVGLIALGAATNLVRFRGERQVPVISAILAPPPNVSIVTLGDLGGPPVISRDGRNLAFAGLSDGVQMIFVRALNSAGARALTGTEHGKFPFWSPEGKSIGFFADGQLKRVDLAGGPPLVLAPAPDGRGGSWAGDTILFAPDIYQVIYRTRASGGAVSPVTKMDRPQHTTHRWPYFLPDGKHFLYLAANHRGKEENSAIYASSIEDGEPKFILRNNGSPLFASGNLVYFRDGSLMGQDFDSRTLELRGEAVPLGQVIRESGNWKVMVTASENGVLIYQGGEYPKDSIRWYDRNGRAGAILGSAKLGDLRLSPDGTRAAVLQEEGPITSLYVWNLRTGARTRLTFGGGSVPTVVWSPDGTRLVYAWMPAGRQGADIYVKLADGSGEARLVLSSGLRDDPTDWSPDGRYVIFNRGEIGDQRVWILPMFGDRKPFPLHPNADYDHNYGLLSPNGRWIAYQSRETGPLQLFVTDFPRGSSKWQASSGNITDHRWQADGKGLTYVAQDGNVIAASTEESGGSFEVTGTRVMFRSPFANGRLHAIFDVERTPGGRFLGEVAPEGNALTMNVVTNWTELLKK
jgi:Tol biopolymer transport system component